MTTPATSTVILAALAQVQTSLKRAITEHEDAKNQLQVFLRILNPSLAPLQETVEETKGFIADLEISLQGLLLQYHAISGDRVAPGFGEVKESKGLEYNKAEALTWAKAHGIFLTLDTAAFEKFCQGQADQGLPEFVRRTKDWKPYINRKALAENS